MGHEVGGGEGHLSTGEPRKVFEQVKSIIGASTSLLAFGSPWMSGFWVGEIGRAPGRPRPPPGPCKDSATQGGRGLGAGRAILGSELGTPSACQGACA